MPIRFPARAGYAVLAVTELAAVEASVRGVLEQLTLGDLLTPAED